jgi:hypothetical protein
MKAETLEQIETELPPPVDAAPEPSESEREKSHEQDVYRFDEDNPPTPSKPVYQLGMAKIATRGNIIGIYARPKDGKTATLGAAMASTMTSTGDTFGFASDNPDGLAVIHIDSEQSREAFYAVIATAKRRAGISKKPSWLRSTSILSKDKAERFAWLEFEMEQAKKAHGGIHSVLIDGIGDFVQNPNDGDECFAVVTRLHQLAVKYDTVIFCVLHFNPNPEYNKARGHLGSELERKCETNLTLEKKDGVTVIYTTTARHAEIPKEKGHRFQWSDDAGMHVTCDAETADASKKKRPTKYDVQSLLVVGQTVSKRTLLSMANEKMGFKKAEGFIAQLVDDGILKEIKKPRPRTNPEIFLERVL